MFTIKKACINIYIVYTVYNRSRQTKGKLNMATLNQKIDEAREEIIEDQLCPEQDKHYYERVHALDFDGELIYTINAITGEKTRYRENPPKVDLTHYELNEIAFGHWAGEL